MNQQTSTDTNEFSIVIIPDTQTMTKHHSHLFKPMTQWIVDHAVEMNLKIVLHLGDVVDDGANDEDQYRIADEALQTIYKAGLPILIAPGNHDYDNLLAKDRSLIMFNKYFGVHRYEGESWFGGTFESGKAENCFAALDTEVGKFLFVALEFGPRDEVLRWADEILTKHSDHQAFIITHCYMYMYGERTRPGNTYNPKGYKGALGANDGEDLWQKSFKRHPNLIAVFSGHQITENISYRTDVGEKGNCVFQSFQNWQCAEKGGEGRIRILKYRASEKAIRLQVVNPNTGQYESDAGYEVDTSLHRIGPNEGLKFP
jgi:hypothetical protein